MTAFNVRDEREAVVDLEADRVAFLVLAFGTLLAAAWRGFNGDSAWDLLALVVLAGAAGMVYRFAKGVITRSWVRIVLATVAGAALIAALVSWAGLGRP
jgi:hypothetical protein